MAGFLLAFFILIVAMLVVERVNVRVIYREEFIIRIYFLVFELILYPSRNRKRRRKRNNFICRIKKGLSSANATRRALEYLFACSRVTVRELDLTEKFKDNPAKLAIISQRNSSIITAILTYLSYTCESLVTEKTPLIVSSAPDNIPLTVDVSLNTTLIRVISSFAVYYSNLHRYKRKRRRKIV